MRINLVTIFPEFFDSPLSVGVTSGAIEKGLLEILKVTPRTFTQDFHKTVDDRPFGGGDGMVMKTEPLKQAVESLGDQKGHVVVLSPSGRVFNAQVAREYASLDRPLTLVCGRYSGIDQRFIETCADEELSVGDFILSGGEPAALSVIDSVARLIPGVLGNADSPEQDSFYQSHLECPVFTRPREALGLEVPEVLLCGDPKKIGEFQKYVSLLRTWMKRPDLLSASDEEGLEMAKDWCKSLSEPQKKALGLSGV